MWARDIALQVACDLAAAMALPGGASAQERPIFAGALTPYYQHIFLIMLENLNYDQIVGSPLTPRINAPAQTYGFATNYYGMTHPSEPNYVASIGGSYFGIQDESPYNCNPESVLPECSGVTVGHTNQAPSLADQLAAAGLTWKTYQQSLPPVGYTGTRRQFSGPTLYAAKHSPFLNFAGTQNGPALQDIVPDPQLALDLQSDNASNFSYIVPDQCHDMHGTQGCADDATLVPAGDQYVAGTAAEIVGSSLRQQGNNAIVITWDEDDFSPTNTGRCDANPGRGHVATIVITNHGVRGAQDGTAHNHYSLLQTIEDAFRLGCLQNACDCANVRPMTELFKNGAP